MAIERDIIVIGEQWRPVPDFPAYEASSRGRVRRNGRILRTHLGKSGYPYIQLWRDGEGVYQTLHGVIAKTFLGARPDGAHVSHLDGDRTNAWSCNLAYETPTENQARRRDHGTDGRGERNPAAKLTQAQVDQIRIRLGNGEQQAAIARDYGITRQGVWFIARGRTWAEAA